MSASLRADVTPRYYGEVVPFYLNEKSEVKVFYHQSFEDKKILMGTFVLEKGEHQVKTLKSGLYSLAFSAPPEDKTPRSKYTKSELNQIRLSYFLREAKKDQSLVAQ